MKIVRGLVVTALLLAPVELGCGGGSGTCSVNADCAAQGGHPVCRADTGTCVELTSEQCNTVYGDYKNDNAFVVGSVLSTTGPDKSYGLPMQDSLILAMDEINAAAGGLPPRPGGTARRPMALVGCSDSSDANTGVQAAQHLTGTLGLPVIVGTSYSGITLKIATAVTIPAGALIISPAATSISITNLPDNGLVWRTSPSDVYQAKALSLYVPTIEQQVRSALSIPTGSNVKLALLNKGDAYGQDLASALELQLNINGSPATSKPNQMSYLRVDYGNPDDPTVDPPRFAAAAAQVIAFQPHILVMVGTTEGVTDVLPPIEQGWTASYRAQIVLTDGEAVPELWKFVGNNDALRKRVTGTVPGTDSTRFQAFQSAFTKHAFTDGSTPDTFGTAGAYDIGYLLAYSAAAIGSAKVTGTSLANGLGKLVPTGPEVDAGPAALTTGFATLAMGKNIDYNGASGPLDFDLKTGEAASDIQVWCLPKNSSGSATSDTSSGLYFDAKSGQLAGAIGSACN